MLLRLWWCLLLLTLLAWTPQSGSLRVNKMQLLAQKFKQVLHHATFGATGKSYVGSTKIKMTPADNDENKSQQKKSAFDQVASAGLAGILAIAVAEAIFWAFGVPLAEVWYKISTGEWIDFGTTDGQLKAAGFSFGYGGFATLILQYRVTLFAIPLVPVMDKFVVTPLRQRLRGKGDS